MVESEGEYASSDEEGDEEEEEDRIVEERYGEEEEEGQGGEEEEILDNMPAPKAHVQLQASREMPSGGTGIPLVNSNQV